MSISRPHSDPPLRRPVGRVSTAAAKSRDAERLHQREGRATRRFRIARFLQDMWADHDWSINELAALLDDAIANGDPRVAGIPSPSRATVARLVSRAKELEAAGVALSTDAFRDVQGQRPAPVALTPLQTFVEECILLRPTISGPDLLKEVGAFCDEWGMARPSLSTLQRIRAGMDLAAMHASAFGRKAAENDVMQKATLPTDFPHHVWTLDESPLPVWVRVWDEANRCQVATKPYLIAIIDNHSRVVVGYWIAEPGTTLTAAARYDQHDILGAFFTAALRPLAPPACAPYAGFLPRVLRMDKSKTHHRLVELCEANGVEVPDLPAATPYKRGMIERLLGTLKRFCGSIHGHEDTYAVAAQQADRPGGTRTRVAGKGDRHLRRTLIATKDLLTMDELREAFDARVAEYHARRHRILQTSPEGRYAVRFNPAQARRGFDVVTWQKPVVLTCQPSGLAHRHVNFLPSPVLGITLTTGDKYPCYPDPLRRALFTYIGSAKEKRMICLEPADVVARHTDVPSFERERLERLRDLSIDAQERLDAVMDRKLAHVDNWRAHADAEVRIAQEGARKSRNAQAKQSSDRRKASKAKVAANARATTKAAPPLVTPVSPAALTPGKKPRVVSTRPSPRPSAPVPDDLASRRAAKTAPVARKAPARVFDDEDEALPFGMTKTFGQRG